MLDVETLIWRRNIVKDLYLKENNEKRREMYMEELDFIDRKIDTFALDNIKRLKVYLISMKQKLYSELNSYERLITRYELLLAEEPEDTELASSLSIARSLKASSLDKINLITKMQKIIQEG